MNNGDQVQLLFALRSHSLFTKDNRPEMHKNDPFCDLCRIFPCTMAHILTCPKISVHAKLVVKDLKHIFLPEWIYGTLEQQLKITQIYQHLINVRESVLSQLRSQGTRGFGDGGGVSCLTVT